MSLSQIRNISTNPQDAIKAFQDGYINKERYSYQNRAILTLNSSLIGVCSLPRQIKQLFQNIIGLEKTAAVATLSQLGHTACIIPAGATLSAIFFFHAIAVDLPNKACVSLKGQERFKNSKIISRIQTFLHPDTTSREKSTRAFKQALQHTIRIPLLVGNTILSAVQLQGKSAYRGICATVDSAAIVPIGLVLGTFYGAHAIAIEGPKKLYTHFASV